MIHPINCSLEDLYNGKTVRIKVSRDRKCKDCNAISANESCTACAGSGYCIVPEIRGPGIVREIKVICDSCNGKGEFVS